MVSQMSFGALGDVVARRMDVGKDKGRNEESVQNGSEVWAAGGVLTCYLELALHKQALALQGKGC